MSSPETIIPPSQATSRAFIAFVGTLGAGLTWGGSIYVNPLMARVKTFKPITIAGASLMSLGYFLASFSTSTWHLLLTQGLLYGIGSSMFYFPYVSVAPEYFDKHRGAAMGIILSAAGIGGLSFSLFTRKLLEVVGARWALRAIALENLCIAGPIAFLTLPSRSPVRRPTMVRVNIAKKPAFILQAVAAMLQASGNFVPMTFTPEFSTVIGYTASFGAVLLSINNGVNSVSRILTGVLADSLGRQNVLIASNFGSALAVLVLWMAAASGMGAQGPWIAFVVFYGILAGGMYASIVLKDDLLMMIGYNALFPVTISEVFGIQAYASVNGFLYFIRGLGAAFGSPVGGQILGDSRATVMSSADPTVLSDYRKLIWYDGALLIASSLCVVGVRGFDALEKKKWAWKA